MAFVVAVCVPTRPASSQTQPASQPAATRPAGSTSAPAASAARQRPADCDDRWLSQVVLDELAQCKDPAAMAELKLWLEPAVLGRAACGYLDRLGGLNDLVYALRACRYLPLAAEAVNWEYAAWLRDNRGLSRLLFRALEDVRSPESALASLHELRQAEPTAVVDYAELAVAFVTVQPAELRYGQAEAASLLESFRWYANPKGGFRYDLRAMPFELSRYLADTRLSIAERSWAAQRYARHNNPPKAYFDVDYDYDHFLKGKPRRIADLPYTLPNLARVGGICSDQAYYAAQVCKALGVPAASVAGKSRTGVEHAWVASLRVRGRSAAWDCTTGRYPEQRFYIGEIRDPADGRTILDCELMLGGSAALLPLDRREEADAATTAARMVERARQAGRQPDLTALEQLARLFDQRFGEGNRPKAVTKWIAPNRALEPALVEDLLAVALERNLAHKPTWQFLVDLAKTQRLPSERLDRFFDLLIRRTAREHPDFSCRMILDIVPTVEDAQRRVSSYANAVKVYGWRPDLQGRILIATGDDYRTLQADNEKALDAYTQAAWRCLDAADIVVAASEKAEEMYRQAQRLDAAIQMYEKLFEKAEKENISSQFRSQTVHYQIGRRLARLYLETGQKAAANRVLTRIEG